MAEREDSKYVQLGSAAARAGAPVRRLPAARRLLVATVGAATVYFAPGCDGGSAVANLMAPPFLPQSGTGGQGGGAGVSGQGGSGGESGAGGAEPDDMDAGTDDDAGQA
jgi:hypothetical protein